MIISVRGEHRIRLDRPTRPVRVSRVETRRALLLIADIGGYTEYMQFHRTILGYAEAATTRLLEKVVDAAHGFDLIEIEADAAFLSRRADALDAGATVAAITEAVLAMHRAFHAERRLVELNLCPCESCTQTSDLKLKFVTHVGEVASQTIKRRRKLVGMDVILVHRLLKNSVRAPEYVLFSEDLYRGFGTHRPGPPMHEVSQDLEGIGPVGAYLLEVEDLAGPRGPVPDPSWLRRFGGTLDPRPGPAVHAPRATPTSYRSTQWYVGCDSQRQRTLQTFHSDSAIQDGLGNSPTIVMTPSGVASHRRGRAVREQACRGRWSVRQQCPQPEPAPGPVGLPLSE